MPLKFDEKASAERLSRVLLTFYEHHYRASSLQIAILLTVAAHPGITTTDILDMHSLHSGTVSRALGLLGEKGYKNVPAMGLIQRHVDVSDNRVVHWMLTKEGEDLVKSCLS